MATQEEVNEYIVSLIKHGVTNAYAVRAKMSSNFNITDVDEVDKLVKKHPSLS